MEGMNISQLDKMNYTGPEPNMYPAGAKPLPDTTTGGGPGSSGLPDERYTPSGDTAIDVFCGNVNDKRK